MVIISGWISLKLTLTVLLRYFTFIPLYMSTRNSEGNIIGLKSHISRWDSISLALFSPLCYTQMHLYESLQVDWECAPSSPYSLSNLLPLDDLFTPPPSCLFQTAKDKFVCQMFLSSSHSVLQEDLQLYCLLISSLQCKYVPRLETQYMWVGDIYWINSVEQFSSKMFVFNIHFPP